MNARGIRATLARHSGKSSILLASLPDVQLQVRAAVCVVRGHSCIYSDVYSHWQLIINAEALRGYSDTARLRLSKHCLYVNSQHGESFKEAL